MLRRLVPLLLLITFLPVSAARAQPDSAIRVAIVSHGVRLTLTVPRRIYPRNAVIQVKLTVKNVSHHGVYIASGLQAPIAYVLDSSGIEVYDPYAPLSNETLVTQKGPGPVSFLLRRGKAWEADPYLVLRGSRIGYRVIIGRFGHGTEVTVTGRSVSVRLTPEVLPQVSLSTVPTLRATISQAVAVSGPLLYYSQTSCQIDGARYSTGSGWSIAHGTSIEPEFYTASGPGSQCDGTKTWHALAGWLNHPVATITYSSG